MSRDVRPLPLLWNREPGDGDLQAVKAAFVSLGLSVLVQPVRAVPGGAGRVICIDCEPDWIVDFARIDSVNSKGLPNAIRWSLSDADDPRAFSMADMLTHYLGCEVKELESERIEQKVRFQ